MDTQLKKFTSPQRLRNFIEATPCRAYFIKAVALLCGLALIGYVNPQVPGIIAAIFWVLVTAFSAIGFAYFAIVKKTEKQIAKFREGGRLANFNEGRKVCFFIAFVVSGVFSASLLLNISKWEPIYWILIAMAIPLYYFVSKKVKHKVEIEYKPLFRQAGITKLTFWIVVAILCAIALLVTLFFPFPSYESTFDALIATKAPFSDSSSALIADMGYFTTASEIMITYGIPKTLEAAFGQFPFIVVTAGTLLVYLSIFVGFVSLLNVCYISPFELQRVFTPLLSEQSQAKPSFARKRTIEKKYVFWNIGFALLFMAVFIAADTYSTHIKEANGQTPLEVITFKAIDGIAYIVDDKNLSDQMSERLLTETQNNLHFFGNNNSQAAETIETDLKTVHKFTFLLNTATQIKLFLPNCNFASSFPKICMKHYCHVQDNQTNHIQSILRKRGAFPALLLQFHWHQTSLKYL